MPKSSNCWKPGSWKVPRNTKHLRVDLSETEAKWAAKEKIEVLATLQESWEKKLLYISSLLEKLEEEVVNAPAAASQDDEDTSESRQFNLRTQDRIFDKARQVFIRWKITFQRSKELFKDLIAVFEVKDKGKTEAEGQNPDAIPQTKTKMSPQPMQKLSDQRYLIPVFLQCK